MNLKKILGAKNTNHRLFIVFYCDGDIDFNKVQNKTKNICLQTLNGPVFQVIGVFVDKDFINFIHSLTTNTKLITSIDSMSYLELNEKIISAKVFYDFRSYNEIFNYDFTDEHICDIVEKYESVTFKDSYSYNNYNDCHHKICDKCYLDNIVYCDCKPELSTYNYFTCRCLENFNLNFVNLKTNLSLSGYRFFCVSEEDVKIIFDEKHPKHNEICKKIDFSINLYYS